MPASGNIGFQMTPLPTPEAQSSVPVQTYADTAQQNQPQAPPVYYGGKAGTSAFYADKILTGWLAGTKIAQEKKAKAMSDEVNSAKTGYEMLGQALRSAMESGDPERISKATAAVNEAKHDFVTKARKYAMPDEQIDPKTGKPKKPGVGAKIKSGLGMDNPHLPILNSTLDLIDKADPKEIWGPSKQEQQQNKLLDMQTKQMEDQQRDHDRWTKISQGDPSKMTPEDKRFQENYEYEHFGKTREQQMKDDLLGKISENKPLSDQERQLAENFGLIKPKVVNTVTRTVPDKKGNPQTQLVSIGPDGQVVGTQTLPGNDYVPPNQAQMAGQVINAQMSAMMKWGAKAHPEWDQKTPEGQKALTQWALSTVAGGSAGASADWYTKNQQMDVMNRALGAVLQKHTKDYKDPNTGAPTTQRDDLASAVFGNIVSTTDDGRYAYMPSLNPPKPGETHWFGKDDPETWSGMTREQLNDAERRFQAELRAELKKQNPKLADADIDKMVPQMLTSQKGGQQMQPPPQQGGPQAMAPPPDKVQTSMANAAKGVMPGAQAPPGEAYYRVRMPDGSIPIRHMTPEYAEALKARGITVEPVDQ
jgi:hypothetical protein